MENSRKIILGSQISLDDLFAVCGGCTLSIDPALWLKAIERSKAVALGKELAVELKAPMAKKPLPLHTCRCPNSRIRAEFAGYLLELLNAGIVPILCASQPEYDLSGLANSCFAAGYCYVGQDSTITLPLNEALESASISAPTPPLTESEFSVLCTGSAVATALIANCAFSAKRLLSVVDCSSAMTCEALKCSSASLDPSVQEVIRPHRGIAETAERLRLLLEDSRQITAKSTTPDADPIAYLPQCTGPPRESVLAAVRSMIVEINAAECCGRGREVRPFDLQPLEMVLHQLLAAVEMLEESVFSRLALLGEPLEKDESVAWLFKPPTFCEEEEAEEEEEEATCGGCSGDCDCCDGGEECDCEMGFTPRALSLVALIDGTFASCCKEIIGAERLLRNREKALAEKAMAKQKAKLEAAAAREKAQALKAEKERGEFEAKLATMDEAGKKKAIAAAEKKRAKLAKKSAKKAGKGKAKSGSAVLPSGKGVRWLRKWWKDAVSAALERQDVKSVVDAFSVWDTSPDGFESKFSALLEELGSGGAKRKPKIAKGARDFMPEQMEIREKCFNLMKGVFKRHGAVEIDTPVFELKEMLLGKYGEEGGKLIYDLADQGGELLSLRYDLTVPFARFVAMNRLKNIKRYHISRVYRRDQPQTSRGRYREFYQCDYDVAGAYGRMIPDADVLAVAVEILGRLPIGGFLIKVNHRRLLDAMLDICGVSAKKFKPICSSIDKLDKESWEDVRCEMIHEKGLSEKSADMIGSMVQLKGRPKELHALLMGDPRFNTHEVAMTALEDMRLLFEYLDAMGYLDSISFDLSLARGLDYYTGAIFEAVLTDSDRVGSIAGGGRYDYLVGMFSATDEIVPCVGISIGIERVFTIMEEKAKASGGFKCTPVNVMVASVGKNMVQHRLSLAAEMWRSDISAELVYDVNPKMAKQLNTALDAGIPLMLVIGEDEIASGVVQVKDIVAHTQTEVKRGDLVQFVRDLLAGGGGGATSGSGVAPPVPPPA